MKIKPNYPENDEENNYSSNDVDDGGNGTIAESIDPDERNVLLG